MKRLLIPWALAAVVLALSITLTFQLKEVFISEGVMFVSVFDPSCGYRGELELKTPFNVTVSELFPSCTGYTNFTIDIMPQDPYPYTVVRGYAIMVKTNGTISLPANCTDGAFAYIRTGNAYYIVSNVTATGFTVVLRSPTPNTWIYVNIAVPPKGWESLPLCPA